MRGVPEPCVRWFKDGEPLLASDRHAIRRTDAGKCTLTIAEVVDCDAGRYSCEAVNDQGRVCTLTVVQVIANRRIVEAERRLQGWVLYDTQYKLSFNFPLPKILGFYFMVLLDNTFQLHNSIHATDRYFKSDTLVLHILKPN